MPQEELKKHFRIGERSFRPRKFFTWIICFALQDAHVGLKP